VSYSKQLDQYQKSAVAGASPLQLIIMLYDGALKFLGNGKLAMAQKDLYQQNDQLQRAQKIITELMSCLDMEKGGEIATNLFALYSYAYNEIIMGNVEDDPSKIEHAMAVLTQLRESWVTLEQQQRTGLRVQDGGSNDLSAAA